MNLTSIATFTNISQQNAYRYLKKLSKKELIRRDSRDLYHLSELGSATLNGFFVGGAHTESKPFNPPGAKNADSAKSARSGTRQTELQALEVHYPINRTEYSKLEAVLTSLDIPFKQIGNPQSPFYSLVWKGTRIKLTHSKIVSWGQKRKFPMQIQHDVILDVALQRNLEAVSDFLQRTNIKHQETVDHRLIATVRYYELAEIGSELAAEVTKNGGRIILAYDKQTGEMRTWADKTPTPDTLEFNKGRNRDIWAKQQQGIQDGLIDPFNDEMRTRSEIASLLELQKTAAQTQSGIIEQQKYELQFFTKHNRLIEDVSKLVRKLDRKISQSKLGDF